MPSDSSAEEARARLKDLRDGLLHLHSTLLHSERSLYEHEIERIHSPGRFLELVLTDPAFAWLRELSQLVVLIDEAMENDEPPGRADADRWVARARTLLSPAETGAEFESRYLDALQRDPNVVIAHSAMQKLLRQLE